MATNYVFKPREVINGLKKLGFEVLSGRGKGDHVLLARVIRCQNDETHTAKALVDRTANSLHPKAVATICARTGLTEEKLQLAIKGKYTRKQYEADIVQIPKIDFLSPEQKNFKTATLRDKGERKVPS
jgi:predicted RNA binding protein YcfA (HicA-like mRNA interferase family)